jgi:S1-C subfamily serine protease
VIGSGVLVRVLAILSAGVVLSASDRSTKPVDDTGVSVALIEHGVTTATGTAPFAVSVAAPPGPGRPVSHVCTGFFIGKGLVVTAKHCLIAHAASTLVVRYGSVNLDAARRVKVTETACSTNLDAGLLFIDEPIDIPAATLGSATSGNAVAFGWGDSSFPSKVLKPGRSPNLLQVGMTITNEAGACVMSPDRVCAEAPSAGPCAGDSGGPLVKGKSKVVGVLSTVSSCPRTDGERSAATYTSGSSVKKWVQAASKLTKEKRQAAFACQP